MSDLYIFDFGGGPEERTRCEAERDAERVRLRDRYAAYLVENAAVGRAVAQRVVHLLFDHSNSDGRPCMCGCHPRLSAEHGDGFGCRCTWTREQARANHRDWLKRWRSAPWANQLRSQQAAEERAIFEWLTHESTVEARRTSSYAPEQWEGVVDGRSFYFRERHGE